MIAYLLSASQAGTAAPSATSMEQMISMLVSLFVVLAVAVGLAWLWKRLMPQNLLGNRGLDVVATRHIGSKERLMLVKVAERYLLLGVTSQNIQTLAEFNQEELPEALLSVNSGAMSTEQKPVHKELQKLWQSWQNRKS